MVHMQTIYFQNPISIPDYHANFQNYRAKIEDQNVVSGVYSEFLFECNNKKYQTILIFLEKVAGTTVELAFLFLWLTDHCLVLE